MSNHYETPEAVEIGRAQDVILGHKLGPDVDPETGEYCYDVVLNEIDE